MKDNKDIIVVGSSGHAKVVIDTIEAEGTYRVIGLLDSFRKEGEITQGYPVIGGTENLKNTISKFNTSNFVIAIGDNWSRKSVVQKMTEQVPDVNFITIIHPYSSISKRAEIGDGCVIMPGVVVNSNARIGNHVLLNTNSSLDHDSVMEDFSSLAVAASTGGKVHIGELSAISIGAMIVEGVNIGRNSIIGAQSLVLKNTEEGSLYYGSPAKFIRKWKAGDKYLK